MVTLFMVIVNVNYSGAYWELLEWRVGFEPTVLEFCRLLPLTARPSPRCYDACTTVTLKKCCSIGAACLVCAVWLQ